MLCTQNLSVTLRGRVLLRDITVSIPCGSLVAVIGPNGAGKSTLLRALTGDIAPSRGTVTMAGRLLQDWSLRDRALRRAVLEQDYGLSFPLRCLDVVLLGRTAHQQQARTAEQRLDDQLIARAALDAVELCERADDSYDILSGGQRQLVQLARVLAQIWEPPHDANRSGDRGQRYLLLDEPTASLDLRYQHMVLSRARRLAREGVGVLAILHDLNLAAQYADQLILLSEGALVAQGSPSQVLSPATLQAVFGVAARRLDAAGPPVIATEAAFPSFP